MASLSRSISRLFVRSPLRVLSVRTTYSNPNKPNSKQEVKQAINEAESGKASRDVSKHRAATGETLAGETNSNDTKPAKEAASTEDAINTPNSGPDVLRQAAKKSK